MTMESMEADWGEVKGRLRPGGEVGREEEKWGWEYKNFLYFGRGLAALGQKNAKTSSSTSLSPASTCLLSLCAFKCQWRLCEFPRVLVSVFSLCACVARLKCIIYFYIGIYIYTCVYVYNISNYTIFVPSAPRTRLTWVSLSCDRQISANLYRCFISWLWVRFVGLRCRRASVKLVCWQLRSTFNSTLCCWLYAPWEVSVTAAAIPRALELVSDERSG